MCCMTEKTKLCVSAASSLISICIIIIAPASNTGSRMQERIVSIENKGKVQQRRERVAVFPRSAGCTSATHHGRSLVQILSPKSDPRCLPGPALLALRRACWSQGLPPQLQLRGRHRLTSAIHSPKEMKGQPTPPGGSVQNDAIQANGAVPAVAPVAKAIKRRLYAPVHASFDSQGLRTMLQQQVGPSETHGQLLLTRCWLSADIDTSERAPPFRSRRSPTHAEPGICTVQLVLQGDDLHPARPEKKKRWLQSAACPADCLYVIWAPKVKQQSCAYLIIGKDLTQHVVDGGGNSKNLLREHKWLKRF